MKEYIERELLLIGVDGCISTLHAQAKGDPIQEGAIKMVEATRDYIASLSAADVAPVRHGRWNVVEALSDDIQTAGECNICGENINWFGKLPNYCPNCGARMDKEDEHEVS